MLPRFIHINKNYYKIKTENLTALIRGNLKDALLSATVTKAPQEPEEAITAIRKLMEHLIEKMGGKIWLKISPEIKSHIASHPRAKEIFNQHLYSGSIKFISNEARLKCLEIFSHDNNIQSILINPHLQFLVTEEDYEEKYEELYYFRNKQVESRWLFSNPRRAYSQDVEQDMVNNPYVQHFAIFNEVTESFIATLKLFVDADLAYIADVSVDKTLEKKNFALSLTSFAFKYLCDYEPQVKEIWLVGDDSFLNIPGLSLPSVTSKIQRESAVVPIITTPKEWLLNVGLEENATFSSYLKNCLWAGAAMATIGITVSAAKYAYWYKKN